MPISHKHRVIFVHIPKTSGTYIENAFGMHENLKKVGLQITKQGGNGGHNNHLWGGGAQHWTLSTLKSKINAETFNSYCKFAIVRNPYSRLVSEMAWSSGHKSWQNNGKMSAEEFTAGLRKVFNQFKSTGKYGNVHLRPQADFVLINGEIAVDKLFKMEQYNEVEEFMHSHGVPVKSKKRMTSDRHPIEYYLSAENKELIYEMYARDFELFGYEK